MPPDPGDAPQVVLPSPAAGGTIVRMASKRATRREETDSASLADWLAADFHDKKTITRKAVEAFARLSGTGPASVPADDEAALAALQTWYFLVVKLLTAEAMAVLTGKPSIAAALDEARRQRRLRAEIDLLQSGPLLRSLLPDAAACPRVVRLECRGLVGRNRAGRRRTGRPTKPVSPGTFSPRPERGSRRFPEVPPGPLPAQAAARPGRILHARLAGRARARSGWLSGGGQRSAFGSRVRIGDLSDGRHPPPAAVVDAIGGLG